MADGSPSSPRAQAAVALRPGSACFSRLTSAATSDGSGRERAAARMASNRTLKLGSWIASMISWRLSGLLTSARRWVAASRSSSVSAQE